MKKCANCARENRPLSWLDATTPYFGSKLCAACRIEKLLAKPSIPTAHVTGLYFALLTLVEQFKKPDNTALAVYVDEPMRVLTWYEVEGVALMRTTPSNEEKAFLAQFLASWHLDMGLIEQMTQTEAAVAPVEEVSEEESVSVPPHLYGVSCAYCGEQAESIDHIVPRAFGGPDHESNYVASCLYCNQLKGHDTFQQFLTFRIHFDLEQWRQFKRHHWTKQEIAAYKSQQS